MRERQRRGGHRTGDACMRPPRLQRASPRLLQRSLTCLGEVRQLGGRGLAAEHAHHRHWVRRSQRRNVLCAVQERARPQLLLHHLWTCTPQTNRCGAV